MNRKLKLALAALLGFSAACSTVRNAPKQGAGNQGQEAAQDTTKRLRIVVMYGVRPPQGGDVAIPLKEAEDSLKTVRKDQVPELDPVAESPED